MNRNLVSQAVPEYPEEAKAAHISGTVLLHVVVNTDGLVQLAEYVSGPPLLKDSATNAVRQWRYEPTLLNGYPIEVYSTVSVVYSKLGWVDTRIPAFFIKQLTGAMDKAEQSQMAAPPKSVILPSSWTRVNVIEYFGQTVFMGGTDRNAGRLGVYDIRTGRFFDITDRMPQGWCPVKSLAFGNKELLFVGGGRREGCVAMFSPTDGSFWDMTSKFRGRDSGPFYYGGITAIGFNGRSLLIGGAGLVESLEMFSPDNERFTNVRVGNSYFAVNTIALRGDTFLIAGAGPGPGPAQPPALGLISSDESFSDLTEFLPKGWGATWHSAYDGKEFFIQGLDVISGENQMLALFDPDKRTATNVTSVFPSSFKLHCADGRDGYFLVGGEVNGTAYLGRYIPGASTVELTNLLPDGSLDVTAVKIVGNNSIAVGTNRQGQIFVANIAAEAQ
jgi:TonB family protein